MIPLTVSVSIACTRTVNLSEWIWGWTVAGVNVALAVAIYTYAWRKRGNAFLVWALGVNGARALCMVGTVIAVCVLIIRHPLPYLIAALSGTVCLMTAEVYYLYRRLA